MYVLIVLGWMGTQHLPSIATHDVESFSACRAIAAEMEKHFVEYHIKAFCQPKGEKL